MKALCKDPFDYILCIRGLGNLVTYMDSEIYEYLFYFTFRTVMKNYKLEFTDPWRNFIAEMEFFEEIDQPFVQHSYQVNQRLTALKNELVSRFLIEELVDLDDANVEEEADRFKPYTLFYKHSKSLKMLKHYYERTLKDIIRCLFLYACALTAGNNRIPPVLKDRMDLPHEEWSLLLNREDSTVQLLIETIRELKQSLETLQEIMTKPPKKKRQTSRTL